MERLHDPSDFFANSAEAEDAESFSFNELSRDRWPTFLAHAPVDLRDFSHKPQDQTDCQFLCWSAIVAGCSGHADAASRRGSHIEMLTGSPGLRDEL